MKSRGPLIVVALVLAAGAALWMVKGRDKGETRATKAVTHAAGSAATKTTAPSLQSKARASVTITVTNDKGPLAGAMVRLSPGRGDVIVVKTGTDGVARADKLEPERYEISGSANGHEPAALPARDLAAGEDAKLALTLVAGGRVLGGLVTDASGGPVSGARIDAVRVAAGTRQGNAVAAALTGDDGRYQVTVAEGPHLVGASSPDYAPQSRTVEVGASGATADFSLVPGGVIEGFVRDARTNEAVVGAIVDAQRDVGSGLQFNEGNARRAVSGPDGRFRVTGLRPGAYEVGAHADTRRTDAPAVIGLGVAEQVTDVELLVGMGPTISGTVVDETNAPVSDIAVNAFGRGRDGADARTDEQGAFALLGLAPGEYMLMATGDLHVPDMSSSVELADKDITGVVVKVTRGLEIHGHVEPRQPCEVSLELDDEGMAMRMALMMAPQTTGADGAFTLRPASPGKGKLLARCAGGDRGELAIEIRSGMAEAVIAVKPGASIAGRVVDASGKGVAGVTVMASAETGTIKTTIVNGMVTSGLQALTGAQGTYQIVGVPAGEHRLSVLDRGRPARMRSKPPIVKLGATDKKTGVDLAIDLPNGVIEGVVTGPDGKPLADAWVSVHQDFRSLLDGMVDRAAEEHEGESRSRMVMTVDRDDGEGGGDDESPPVLTDAQGRFAVRGLPHARYEVVAEAQAGALRGRAPDVSPDAKITIQALGVTTLSGTVRSAKGPVALFTVELEGPKVATRTFTRGTFKLGRVDPGNYVVRVTSADGNAESKVTVVANQPATVDIVLAANAVVVGKLVDAQGKPVPDVGVTMVPDSGDGRTQISLEGMPPSSGPDGTFRVEAKAGPSVLVVLAQPRPVTKRGLALEAGKTLDVGAVVVDAKAPPPSPP